jgi:uncharacterized OB-fold protein
MHQEGNMTTNAIARTPLTEPFFAGCAEGELRIQACGDCGRMRFYPTEACPFCASPRHDWRRVSGRGRVYSWTVVHRSVDPSWQARAPYIVAVVELDEQAGLLVPGLLSGVEPDGMHAGMPVEAWFEAAGEGVFVHRWRPAAAGR